MRKPLPKRSQVIDVLTSEGQPIHAREIAARLHVAHDAYDGLVRLLDDLVFDGAAVARGERYQVSGRHTKSKSATERREGTLRLNPRGFGFVASPTAVGDDVFVHADSLGGAMHGDTVVVDVTGRPSRGAEGHVVEVKKRGSPRVSGLLRRRAKSAWVEPDDPRVKGPVVLTRSMDLAEEGNSGNEGQVVIVEITRFPESPDENPEGKLIAVLGSPGNLSVEVRKVLLLESIDEVHSSKAVEEAESFGLEVPEAMLSGREDLTHVPLPTIDPEDARDHDDAVWVRRAEKGGYEAWIAIADVSEYVKPGSAIDDEAKARGCSIYLPDRAIPMLPRALSSNLCSLLPGVVRLCLCVHATVSAKGEVTSARLVRGVMKSAAKLTYGGVARALGFTDEPAAQPAAEAMVDDLRVAYELSKVLRRTRTERGALDFELPEPVITLDATGHPKTVTKRAQDAGVKKAYQLIEELMIFANEVVARWLLERELPGVFRIHLPPDPKKLERLSSMCEALSIDLDLEQTQTPHGLQALLRQFADHPLAPVLNNLLLRSMKQAIYDTSNQGHFGLASQAYLHFTSPIRRYPDLVVHRIVHAALDRAERRKGARLTFDQETLAEAAMQSSLAERRAMEIEREVIDIYRCFLMMDRIDERFEGTISAFVASGAYVTVDDPFVDVLVRTEDMGGDFRIEDDGLMATSARSGQTLRLGDRIVLDIIDVALLRRAVLGRRVATGSEAQPKQGRRPRTPVPAARGKSVPRGSQRSGSKKATTSASRGTTERQAKTGKSPRAKSTSATRTKKTKKR